MRISPLIPIVALLAAACGSSVVDAGPDPQLAPLPGEVGIVYRADRATYRQGDSARFILRNESDQPLGYNLCSSSRERRGGAEWTRIPSQRVCTLELRVLAPGAEASVKELITAEWKPGEYRLITIVERMRSGERGPIITPSFTITR